MRLMPLVAVLAVTAASATAETHKVAVHVDQNDPQVMNMALNNIANMARYYDEAGDELIVELVTYGPGLNMLVADSPVADRIATLALEGDVNFAACANTMAGMEAKTGSKPQLLDEAEVVPSGVVRLVELQEDGYAYVRP